MTTEAYEIRERIEQAKQFQEAVQALRERYPAVKFSIDYGHLSGWTPGEDADLDALIEEIVLAAMLVVR